MADINKFTTKEVLNKVLLDSSGNAVAAYSHTSQEALNAVLDSANSRLNVSLVGGTISGDVTINGDLTVNGDGSGTYDEIVNGNLHAIGDDQHLFQRNTNSTNGFRPSLLVRTDSNGTAATGLGAGIEFNIEGTDLAAIHGVFGSDSNEGSLNFQTSANGTLTTAMTIDNAQNVGIGTASPSAKLEINGGADAIVKITGTTTASRFDYATNSHHRFWQLLESDGRFRLYDQTNGAERMSITSAGNVKSGNAGGWYLYNGAPSSTVPAYAFADDTNTGMGQDGADNLTFISGGSKKLQLDDNSRISLGNNDSGGDTTNTVFGNLAGNAIASGGINNSIFGSDAGNDITTGDKNTLVGWLAGDKLSTTSQNVVVGAAAGRGAGYADNVYIGYGVANSTSSNSSNNTLIGSGVAISGAMSGGDNTAVGKSSLSVITSGANNVALGSESAKALTSGDLNTAVGYKSLTAVTIGSDNTAVGYQSLYSETVGKRAVGLGAFALYTQNMDSDNEVSGNVGIGYASGFYNVTGKNNSYIGYYAGSGAPGQSHSNNTAVGYESLKAITTGSSNVAVGYQALDAGTAVTSNVAIGGGALGSNVSGNYSTAVGQSCLLTNTQAFMTAVGYNALRLNSTGSANVGFGYNAGYGNNTGGNNTYIGYDAGKGVSNNANSNNTGIGMNALNDITTGGYNTALGKDAGDSVTSGEKNVFVGTDSGQNTTSQSNCVFVGYNAGATAQVSGITGIGYQTLTALTSGLRNTAIGYLAGSEEVAGNDNTVLGYEALHDGGGLANSSNTIIGSQAGDGTWQNNACNYNTAVGKGAMRGSMDGAAHNVAVGFVSGTAITQGQRNTFVGGGSGINCTTGDKNVALGNDANVAATVDEQIAIGYSTAVTAQYGIAIGHDITTGTNTFAFGKSGAVAVSGTFASSGAIAFTGTSDIRKKRNIKNDVLGLEFINKFHSKTFQWKPQNELPKEWNDYSEENTYDVKKVHHGLIAQEVKEVLDEYGVTDSIDVWSEDADGMQRVNELKLVLPLIKAVQELSAKVEKLEAKLSK